LDLIGDEREGLLVPPNHHEKLVWGILQIVENPELGKGFGENGLRLLRCGFAWEAISERTKRTIDSLL
jgi:glycosyltransferase involved in cell wall biosynthesis